MKPLIPEDQRSPALRSYYKKHERNKMRGRLRANKAYAADPENARRRKYAWRDNNPDKVKESGKRTSIKCGAKKIIYNRKYYQANRDRLLLQSALYSFNHKAELSAYNHTYYLNNFGRFQAYNKQYKINNRKTIRLIEHRRRTRKKQLPYTFTRAQWQFMHQYWGYACAICGRQEGFKWTLALDHWIAITSVDCPGTVATNILPLCQGLDGCNNSKFKHDGAIWLRRRYGPRKANVILRKIEHYFALVRQQDSNATLADSGNVA